MLNEDEYKHFKELGHLKRAQSRNYSTQLRRFGYLIRMPLEHLTLEVNQLGRIEYPGRIIQYSISHLAWESLGIPQKRLKEVATKNGSQGVKDLDPDDEQTLIGCMEKG